MKKPYKEPLSDIKTVRHQNRRKIWKQTSIQCKRKTSTYPVMLLKVTHVPIWE